MDKETELTIVKELQKHQQNLEAHLDKRLSSAIWRDRGILFVITVLTAFGIWQYLKNIVTDKVSEQLKEFALEKIAFDAKTALGSVVSAESEATKILTSLTSRHKTTAEYETVAGPRIDLDATNTPLEATLPDAIPSVATEILVFCGAVSMQAEQADEGFIEVATVSTSKKRFAFNLYISTFSQNAHAFNSDYFWLPYPANRTVSAQLTGFKHPIHGLSGFISIVGYR